MKYYIATKLENHAEHNRLDAALKQLGHDITYDWTVHGPVYSHGLERVRAVAKAEAEGVRDADVVIVLWPGGRGTHVELGMALSLMKPVLFVSEVNDHHEATPETCAFYHHPCVVLFKSTADLIRYVVERSL